MMSLRFCGFLLLLGLRYSNLKRITIMYSIVETGGFQYKVELGKTYKVPSIDGAAVGSTLELKSVLLFSGKEVKVGTPVVADSLVKVEVLAHGKGDTVIVFKKKRRTRYDVILSCLKNMNKI